MSAIAIHVNRFVITWLEVIAVAAMLVTHRMEIIVKVLYAVLCMLKSDNYYKSTCIVLGLYSMFLVMVEFLLRKLFLSPKSVNQFDFSTWTQWCIHEWSNKFHYSKQATFIYTDLTGCFPDDPYKQSGVWMEAWQILGWLWVAAQLCGVE